MRKAQLDYINRNRSLRKMLMIQQAKKRNMSNKNRVKAAKKVSNKNIQKTTKPPPAKTTKKPKNIKQPSQPIITQRVDNIKQAPISTQRVENVRRTPISTQRVDNVKQAPISTQRVDNVRQALINTQRVDNVRQALSTQRKGNVGLPRNKPSIYFGDNVHSYTQQIRSILPQYLQKVLREKISDEEWKELITELKTHYGEHKAIRNMCRCYCNGWIIDPELRDMNSAVMLRELWKLICNSDTSRQHFKETLDWIAATCIQGISHRIFIDYVAISNDRMMATINKYIPRRTTLLVMEY